MGGFLPKEEKARQVLLYLSGHGLHPGNVGLLNNKLKPHPANKSLEEEHDNHWLSKDEEDWLAKLYEYYDMHSSYQTEKDKPKGFVGGELYVRQRGFVGVLGVLGLWMYHNSKGLGAEHSLSIVVDCCYSGVWVRTLKELMERKGFCYYKAILENFPVAIQSSCSEYEASYSSLFTPLWVLCLKGKNFRREAKSLCPSDPLEHEFDLQHPRFYCSSSNKRKSCCYFFEKEEDTALFDFLLCYYCDLQVKVTKKTLKQLLVHREKVRGSSRRYLKEILQKEGPPACMPERYKEHCTSQRNALSEFLSKFDSEWLSPRTVINTKIDSKTGKIEGKTYFNLKKLTPRAPGNVKAVGPGVYVFPGGVGDMSLIVTENQEEVILIDGTREWDTFISAWLSTLCYLKHITHIVVTHHDIDHTWGIQVLLARYLCDTPLVNLPRLERTTVFMNTKDGFREIPGPRQRSFSQENGIQKLVGELRTRRKLKINIKSAIAKNQRSENVLVEGDNFRLEVLLPTEGLFKKVKKEYEHDKTTRGVKSRGGTTAANVLSVNVVALWKNEAFLFTGDAHLTDVSKAAETFLDDSGLPQFKYVDVPHHGSAKSNIEDVCRHDLGMNSIPAKNYLISSCGNHQNPSFQTITNILKRTESKLYFLYQNRLRPKECRRHQSATSHKCDDEGGGRLKWWCECVDQHQLQIERKDGMVPFSFGDLH
eukprot:m.211331 g.211331  ORF g.211331 m.211331 type:complete len:706 (+) comp39758_c0_seq5:329-2446(+)